MDESLELPTSIPKVPSGDLAPEDDQGSSDEEDGGLDWTKLLPPSARPVIPKRGEKEFEPRAGGGSNLQLHVLDLARSAMFDTLRATRTISSKAVSYASWHSDLARTHVTMARGIHFSNMGHSAPRPVEENGIKKVQKRLELLPEEAIYLIERGSLFCWKQTDLDFGQVPGLNDVNGSPISVQQAYAEMIGREGLTLEKFQVYAYLKRLGYVVTRANPPDIYYPIPPIVSTSKPVYSIMERIKPLLGLWMSRISRTLVGGFNWWKPLRISRWLHHDKNYVSLFKRLRFMTAGHNTPLKLSKSTLPSKSSSPYQIFFNLYKPNTPFKKSAPPPPDFQAVVINAQTTPMPTLQELTDLFDVLPEVPLPPPRQRRQLPGAPITMPMVKLEPQAPPISSQNVQSTLIRRLFPWIFSAPPTNLSPPDRKPNPFVALKTGKKAIVIAVVDASSTSFFRFGQGEFTEWPMV